MNELGIYALAVLMVCLAVLSYLDGELERGGGDGNGK